MRSFKNPAFFYARLSPIPINAIIRSFKSIVQTIKKPAPVKPGTGHFNQSTLYFLLFYY